MSNVVQTQFAGKNPFRTVPKEVNVDSIKITDDKPKGRILRSYKYDPIFKQLAPGKSISCKSEDADSLAQALRSFVKRKNKKWKVSMSKWYTATTGRVFVEELK